MARIKISGPGYKIKAKGRAFDAPPTPTPPPPVGQQAFSQIVGWIFFAIMVFYFVQLYWA